MRALAYFNLMTSPRRRQRQLWVQLHLWPGLLLGAVFALLGLTGSVLCFYPELDLLLNPAQQVAISLATPPRLQPALTALQQAYPQYPGAWRLEMPLAEGRPLNARYYAPAETAGRSFAPLMVTLDPQTQQVSSSRFWGDYAMTWIFDLHYSLLLERPGRITVGVVGILCLFSLLSGLYLWWPSRRQWVTAIRPKIRSGVVRATYDWHTLSGLYGLVVLATLCFTGVVLALPEYVNPLIQNISPLSKWTSPSSEIPAGRSMISVDAAISRATALFPQARLRWVETPKNEHGVFRLNLWQANEPGYRFPKTNVWIDAYSAKVLAVRDPNQHSAGDTFLAWQHPLHNGEAFGLTGRILACVAGLLPLLLWVTGSLRWLQKRRARAVRREPARCAA